MASYTKTNWVNGTTPANATNMNKIEDALEELFNMIYPVGSIYMSVNSANPSTLFGGTWVAWGSGKVPVGVDSNDTDFATVEATGGEKKHTLTINELPAHKHNTNIGVRLSVDAGGYRAASDGPAQVEDNISRDSTEVGGGQSHNILQPYITCYMWKRTA